jgi:ribonuclease P protein component
MIYTVKMKENKDFVSLFKKGKFVCGRACTVYFRKNGTNVNKLGISTGKKAGNAVKRSRCRRVIRQAYRENENLFPKGYNIVISARAAAGECKSTEISIFFKKKVIPAMKGTGSPRKAKPADK